jgi:hypothetical protein
MVAQGAAEAGKRQLTGKRQLSECRSGLPRPSTFCAQSGSWPHHLGRKRPYPANLCSLFCGVEFVGFGEDLGQPIGEPIETMSGRAVQQRATEHLDSVLSEQ